MKKFTLISLILLLLPLGAAAQAYFGYLNYTQVLKQMPAYEQAIKDLEVLRQKYQEEAQRGEEEFQKKFVDFLQGQNEFPQSILLKRQTELQGLMDNGVEFRRQIDTLLLQAEKDLVGPVHEALSNAIQQVAAQRGFHFVLNTEDRNSLYINTSVGEDITLLVLIQLGLVESPQPVEQVQPAGANGEPTGGEAQPAEAQKEASATQASDAVSTELLVE